MSEQHPFITLYQPLGIIGSGGQGRVFKVKDRTSDAIYAAKRICLDSWEEVGKLEREAHVLRQLDHLSIPRFVNYHACTDPISNAPEFILVTQYIEGRNLSQRMGENFPEERLRKVKGQTLDALAHAHERDIVHRDVKPSNIILTDENEVYITDFGLAKVLGERTNSRSYGKGTLAYMAPEQLGLIDASISRHTDYYALGLVLTSLLKGKEREDDIRHKDPREELKTVNSISPSFRQSLEYLVSNNPEERCKGISESASLMPVSPSDITSARVTERKALFEETLERSLNWFFPDDNNRTGFRAGAAWAVGITAFLSFYFPHFIPSLFVGFERSGYKNPEPESPAENLGCVTGLIGGLSVALGQTIAYFALAYHFGPKVLFIPAATNLYSLVHELRGWYKDETEKFIAGQKLLSEGKKE